MRAGTLEISTFLENEDATSSLGRALSALLVAGDTVLLSGPIGAGKTHLARMIVKSFLDHQEDVPSPTFTILQTYQAPDFEIVHADLYRIGDASEIVELGLQEAFGNALVLVEWPDRLGDLQPDNALHVSLDHQEDGRSVTLSSLHHRWAALTRGTLFA